MAFELKTIPKETGKSSSLMGHLAHLQTLPYSKIAH